MTNDRTHVHFRFNEEIVIVSIIIIAYFIILTTATVSDRVEEFYANYLHIKDRGSTRICNFIRVYDFIINSKQFQFETLNHTQ